MNEEEVDGTSAAAASIAAGVRGMPGEPAEGTGRPEPTGRPELNASNCLSFDAKDARRRAATCNRWIDAIAAALRRSTSAMVASNSTAEPRAGASTLAGATDAAALAGTMASEASPATRRLPFSLEATSVRCDTLRNLDALPRRALDAEAPSAGAEGTESSKVSPASVLPRAARGSVSMARYARQRTVCPGVSTGR